MPFALCLTFAGCVEKSASINTDSSPAAITFKRNCAVCHKADGGGQILNGVQVPSLRAERARKASDEHLSNQIANGGGGMPAFGGILRNAEIKMLVFYIRQELQSSDK